MCWKRTLIESPGFVSTAFVMPPVSTVVPAGITSSCAREHIREHRDAEGRMSQNGSSGAELDGLAVLFEHDSERAQIDLSRVGARRTEDEPARGRVVRDHALEVEAEVLVARVDHLDRRQDESPSPRARLRRGNRGR